MPRVLAAACAADAKPRPYASSTAMSTKLELASTTPTVASATTTSDAIDRAKYGYAIRSSSSGDVDQ